MRQFFVIAYSAIWLTIQTAYAVDDRAPQLPWPTLPATYPAQGAPAPNAFQPLGHPQPNVYGEMSREIVRRTNELRHSLGLRALGHDANCTRAILDHVREMRESGQFSHTGANGSTAADRYRRYGQFQAMGENIAMGQRSAEEVLRDWIQSPGHYRNLIGDFTHIGVAVAIGRDGRLWFGQCFSRPA